MGPNYDNQLFPLRPNVFTMVIFRSLVERGEVTVYDQ